MAVPSAFSVLEQLEREGYFERVRNGDQRAASYFAKLAAFRMNPAGSPEGFGWLKKGGGTNVEGYAEDAIVFGSNPLDFNNVVDVVGGAGAPGARLSWGVANRRGSDVWEAPRALSDEQMDYLKPGSSVEPPVGVPQNPPTLPPVIVPCRYQEPNINALVAAVNAALEQATIARDKADQARAIADNLSKRFESGLSVEINAGRLLGTLRGTVRG